MKIINLNLKQGEIKAKIENQDDLWYLSQIIDAGDIIKGRTFRKITTGKGNSEQDKNAERRKLICVKLNPISLKYNK